MEPSWSRAVSLELWSYSDWLADGISAQLLDTLTDFGLVPKTFGDDDPPTTRFDISSSRDFCNLWRKAPNQMSAQRMGNLGFQIVLHLNKNLGEIPYSMTLAIHDEYFKDSSWPNKFLAFAEELYFLLKAVYGNIAHTRDRRAKTVTETSIRVKGNVVQSEYHAPVTPTIGLSGVYWASFFGPTYVDFFSRERVRLAPAFFKKELTDGGYLITTSDSPLDYSSPESREAEKTLIDYLGKDAFFDKNDPDKSLRSPLPRKSTRPIRLRPPPLLFGPSFLANLRKCPECGESERVEEFSRDDLNKLVGFRCRVCSAVWGVHSSLMETK